MSLETTLKKFLVGVANDAIDVVPGRLHAETGTLQVKTSPRGDAADVSFSGYTRGDIAVQGIIRFELSLLAFDVRVDCILSYEAVDGRKGDHRFFLEREQPQSKLVALIKRTLEVL
jgi:hypothetical protein